MSKQDAISGSLPFPASVDRGGITTRKATLFIAGLLIVSYARHRVLAGDNQKRSYLTIRVTSADPESEVSFEGTIVVSGEENDFLNLSQKTPYVLTVEAKSLAAQLHKKEGDASLRVETERLIHAESSKAR